MPQLSNNPNSPRQKMINLMYLVFIAMMALNVSSEVLDGFELVEGSLRTSIGNSVQRNQIVAGELDTYYQSNPNKVKEWYEKGQQVRKKSDDLYNYIQTLKVRIVKEADGAEGNVDNIEHKEDLEAASQIMLAPVVGEGKKLKKAIEAYRNFLGELVNDPEKTKVLEASLSTTAPSKGGLNSRNWQEALFENMPVSAAVTLLTKIQSDVRYAEGEALNYLLKSVDVGDYRVNQITAQVIPQSQVVMRGSQYTASIVLSAIDSTKRPRIVVNGTELSEASKGTFRVTAGASGAYPIKGYIEMPGTDGTVMRRDFTSQYFVTEPTASVAPTLMNVLYAGIANPIRIAVPGVASSQITATMSNGTLTRRGEAWEARPSRVGAEAVISVHARMADGRSVEMAKTAFRVRALPDPLPYIEYTDANGNPRKFKGGLFSKRNLVDADGIKAAIDDDLLNVSYSVLRFELTFFDSMGNAIPEVSNGSNFSPRQKEYIRKLSKGKRFYITRVVAKGPDGIERTIPTIEVIVN